MKHLLSILVLLSVIGINHQAEAEHKKGYVNENAQVRENCPQFAKFCIGVDDAVMDRDIAAIKKYLAEGGNIDPQDNDGWTPLFWAVSNGYLDVVDFLLKSGASPHFADRWGSTPAHYAASGGHVNIFKRLLKSGAQKNARNGDGFTPLGFAILKNHTQMINYLRSIGATE